MNWMVFYMIISTAFVSTQMSKHGSSEAAEKGSGYHIYDTDAESASDQKRRASKINGSETRVTHRHVEVLYTETTTTRTINEERKLRYNEKVYLPEVRGADNTTSEPHQVFKNNISVELMTANRMNEKQAWDQICEPLIGSRRPDGPLDYFDAVQAMRPPNIFPESDEEPASVKFFGEKRYSVKNRSLLTAMKTFLRCLLSVISHVADDSKRRKLTKMFYTSIIGWLKDSLLMDLYSLPDRPEQTIIDMENTVEALVYMRDKHFVPGVAKDALRTYEFINVAEEEEETTERQRGLQVTTAILVTLGAAFLFVLVLLAACVAAALSSPAMQQISELPEEFLPLDYRASPSMDRSGSSQLALPAGYDQQVQKLSVLPDSDIGSKVRIMSERAAQEASPLLSSEASTQD